MKKFQKNFQILLTCCFVMLTGHLQAQSFGSSGIDYSMDVANFEVCYTFVSNSDNTNPNDGWVTVDAKVHNQEATFDLPAFEEWSYNSRKRELAFTIDTTDHDTFTGVAIRHLPSSKADWDQLVKDNEEWFCTCGGQECDCELIKFSHTQSMHLFGEREARRLDEVIWDKDKVVDQKTGEIRFEGPICKTTMILDGSLFYLVMSRYKGSDTERRPELEAIHDRIANSIREGYAKILETASDI